MRQGGRARATEEPGQRHTGVSLDAVRLRREANRRGLSQDALAKLAGVDPGTVGATFAGRHIAMRSAVKIDEALKATPVMTVLDGLLDEPDAAGAE